MAAVLLCCCTAAQAQPSAVKNAAKAAFTLAAYDADGKQTGTALGVLTDNDAVAISVLSPLMGARHATVTDSKGNLRVVTRIVGVNSLYGVACFRTDAQGKTVAAKVTTGQASPGSNLWAASADGLQQVTVSSVETFMDKYAYYILGPTAEGIIGAGTPLFNDAGETVAIVQPSQTSSATHAVDARFITSLQVNAMALTDATLQKINIAPALPSDLQQAQLMLMMAEQTADSLRRESAVADFIEQYPTLSDGYVARARQLSSQGMFAEADKVMATAVKKVSDAADAHYQYSRLIYNKVTADDRPYEPWTLERALDEVRLACSAESLPLYRYMEAQILFSMQQYEAALAIFEELTTANSFKTAELLFCIAQCRQMMGAGEEELLALLDSAITLTDTLQMGDAAPYFLMRGDVYNRLGRYRDASFDYSRYTLLSQQMPSAQFYYIKAQAEVNGKLYQQALNDFAYAILISPNEPLYMAEMAQLYLRVNQPENALKVAERCVAVAPDYTTGHVLYGLALIKSGQQQQGLDELNKARDMGDEQAPQLIERYSHAD